MTQSSQLVSTSLEQTQSSSAAHLLMCQLRRCSMFRATVLAARRCRERLIDRCLGIHTTSMIGSTTAAPTTFADPVSYETTDYLLVRRHMKPLRLTPQDVV